MMMAMMMVMMIMMTMMAMAMYVHCVFQIYPVAMRMTTAYSRSMRSCNAYVPPKILVSPYAWQFLFIDANIYSSGLDIFKANQFRGWGAHAELCCLLYFCILVFVLVFCFTFVFVVVSLCLLFWYIHSESISKMVRSRWALLPLVFLPSHPSMAPRLICGQNFWVQKAPKICNHIPPWLQNWFVTKTFECKKFQNFCTRTPPWLQN